MSKRLTSIRLPEHSRPGYVTKLPTTTMAKNTTSYRLSLLTLSQIDALAERTGQSKANIIQTAIDRMYREEITNMNTLTLEQKQAAATVNRLQQDAETNDTTVADIAAEAGIPTATIQLGQSVLSTHTLRRFDTHSSLSSAHRQADEIEQDGYEPLIEEWSGLNRYVVLGFRPNTTV